MKVVDVVPEDYITCQFCANVFIKKEQRHLRKELEMFDCPSCGYIHMFKRKVVNTMYG